MESGIYIVILNNSNPISVNAHDPRIAERCIRVNRAKCRVGKVKDLEARKKNYFTTFGEANVNFRILVRLANIDIAEKAIKAKLIHFRVRGTTGRPNEWLENIQADEVIGVVLQTLKDLERMGRITIQESPLRIFESD
jgi:hypothetical protein